VGDSSGRIDPITGEGLSVGLVGATMAAEAVEEFLAGEGSLAARYEARIRAFRRPLEQLTGLMLGASRRPWLARLLIRRGKRMASLMRVATGMEPFSWRRLVWEGLVSGGRPRADEQTHAAQTRLT
jgi:flavin-dependent dehydrogenase